VTGDRVGVHPSDYLVVDGLGKHFGEHAVLEGVSFSAARGEVLALLGPSGSGKTTLLRCIAGFEIPDRGSVRVDGEDLTRARPEQRRLGMVFQNYALFPHLSVGRNVAFGIEGKDTPAEIARRVDDVLSWVRLHGQEGRRIAELSGGMQQRVALARAVAPRPRLLLLDEPLSNLDPSLRDRTRRELRQRMREIDTTTLLVTHEQEEAFDLADRVAVLEGGRLHQIGSPEDLYRRPATPFVASFVGRASAIPARLEGGRAVIASGDGKPASWELRNEGPVGEEGQEITVFARPEELRLTSADALGALRGKVVARRFGSPWALYRVELRSASVGTADATVREVEVADVAEAAADGDFVGIEPRPGAASPIAFKEPAG
jgi:ABC-type Fe3+/spermidine/putrescine transport system ATPase subunit